MLIKTQKNVLKNPFQLIRSDVPEDAPKRKVNTNRQRRRREREGGLPADERQENVLQQQECFSINISAWPRPFPLINPSLVSPHHLFYSVAVGEFMGRCVIAAISWHLFIRTGLEISVMCVTHFFLTRGQKSQHRVGKMH